MLCCDHLPLYRQSEIYAREGLELDRLTLFDWVGQAAWLLDPIGAAARRHVFAGEKIHGGDMTGPELAPEHDVQPGQAETHVLDGESDIKERLPCRSTKKATSASITKRPAPASRCWSSPAAG